MSFSTYGVFPVAPALSWPLKEPHSFLDYNYDASGRNRFNGAAAARTVSGPADVDVTVDGIVSATAQAAPSGAGELVIEEFAVAGAIATVWLSDGLPGRSYVVDIQATMASGRVFGWAINVTVDPVFARQPLPPPPSTDFGAPIVWHASGAPLDFSDPNNSALIALF